MRRRNDDRDKVLKSPADRQPRPFCYRPDDVGDFPGVVFLTDIWGIRPANIGMAKRLAEQGLRRADAQCLLTAIRASRPDGFESRDEAKSAMKALARAVRHA